ncbi:MAG: SRPBCC family protein [Acidimicrobiales bacterium]
MSDPSSSGPRPAHGPSSASGEGRSSGHIVVLTTVPAAIEVCYAVAADLEAYPEWAPSVTSVTVDERDDQGRPLRATFTAADIGHQVAYQLAYDHRGAPDRLAWSLVHGDLPSRLDGSYRFEPAQDDPWATDVTYELDVELVIPLPGYVRRRLEDRVLQTALTRFGNRAVARASAGDGPDRDGTGEPPVPSPPRIHRW